MVASVAYDETGRGNPRPAFNWTIVYMSRHRMRSIFLDDTFVPAVSL